MKSLSDLVDAIAARSAKPVAAVDPSQVEHKKLIADRKRQFGSNGQRR